MPEITLFPFSEYWWFYLGFVLFVLFMLALDLGVFHKHEHVVGFKEALGWSVFWMSLGVAFSVVIYWFARLDLPHDPRIASIPGFDVNLAARNAALQYLTGLIIEKSLSVDNLFVFVVLMNFFSIKPIHQHRVLFYGIIGALIFRSIFIAIGAALMNFHWVVVVFGVFLVFTGFKIIFGPEKPIEPEHNPILKLLRRLLPVTAEMHGQKLFVKQAGKLWATPMFVALVFIEFTDVVFAVDSVPAIFAITREPLIVFTSNIFAILGLRALYFLLASVVHKFHLLKYGLGIVLMFVGIKMIWLDKSSLFKDGFPISWSLGFITVVILGSIIASFLFPKAAEEKNVGEMHEPKE
jgi:tellurite resistance protein TerC